MPWHLFPGRFERERILRGGSWRAQFGELAICGRNEVLRSQRHCDTHTEQWASGVAAAVVAYF